MKQPQTDKDNRISQRVSAWVSSAAEIERLEHSLEGILFIDSAWEILYANRAARQSLKLAEDSKGQLVGESLWQLFPDCMDDDVQAHFQHAMSHKVVTEFQCHSGGRQYRVSLRSTDAGLEMHFLDIGSRSQDAQTNVQLSATFKQAAVGMAIAGLDGRFREVNDKFCAILGYTRDELQRMTFRDITYEEDLEKTHNYVQQLLAGHIQDYATEKRYVCKNGSLVWSRTTVKLLHDQSGQPMHFLGVIEDITGRKNAEDALLRRELELRTLADSIPQLAWIAEADGYIFWYNRRWYEYTGTTPEQMLGWGWQSVHDPDILSQVMERWRRSLRTGQPFEMEFPLRGADGSYRWFLTRILPLRDSNNRIVRWFGTNTDVDQVKRIREALQDETRILELLNNTGAMLSSNLDLQTLVQSVTDAATQLSGAKFGAFFYNVIDTKGESFVLYTLSGAPREAFAKFGLPRNTPVFEPTFRGEGVVRSGDITQDSRYGHLGPHHGMPPGHLPVCSYLAVPVTSRSGESIGGLFFGHPDRDVFTERHERIVVGLASQAAIAIDNARLYEAAQQAAEERSRLLESEKAARAEAERSNQMKDSFLATLSHELRTPLNAILGWSQLLRLRSDDVEQLQRGLETIERNAIMQTELIDDLLDMSRITSGKIRLHIESVELAKVVHAAVETVQHAAEAKGIHLQQDIDPQLGVITGDPNRIQQIIWNLLSNAIKFTARKGTVSISARRAGSQIEIRVSDTGIGIRPEHLANIFERFHQIDATTTRRYGGLGLGLSIVKHLVELHGGTTSADSAGENQGATFTVRLPIAAVLQTDDSDIPAVAVDSKNPSFETDKADLHGVNILVVDDEQDARELIERVLMEAGASVKAVGSAAQALDCLQDTRPQLVISDIGMPEMDGYSLIRELRARDRDNQPLPAIALSAYAGTEDRNRALQAGYSLHLCKPIKPAHLIAAVAHTMKDQRATQTRTDS